MRKRSLGFSLLCGVLLLTSCSKDDENDNATFEVAVATLTWSGSPELDGCGFTLKIGETYHKPVNESAIADSYKDTSPTDVDVDVKLMNYHKTVKVCQTGIDMNSIKILDLRIKQ